MPGGRRGDMPGRLEGIIICHYSEKEEGLLDKRGRTLAGREASFILCLEKEPIQPSSTLPLFLAFSSAPMPL